MDHPVISLQTRSSKQCASLWAEAQSVGEKSVGEKAVGEKSVGEKSVGKGEGGQKTPSRYWSS